MDSEHHTTSNLNIFDTQTEETPSDKEDVFIVKEKIKQELGSVKILKNDEGEILTAEGLKSEYQDEEVYRFINTPTFKSWYHGATTERGEPVSLWHATSEKFDKFDPNLIASSRGFANLGAGFYLSFNKEDKDVYLRIAQTKTPRDSEKQLAILKHKENELHFFNELQIVQEKIRNVVDACLACHEKFDAELKEWVEKINAITSERENITYADIKKEDVDIKEPSLLEKAKLLLFDAELKKLIDLKLKIKEILERKEIEIEIGVFDKEEEELRKEKKILEQKKAEERRQINDLMPKGVILQTFANVKNILNFNEPVDQEKLTLIKKKLKENGFDPTQLDPYLAKNNSGETLYNGLTKVITGKEFKLPRYLEPEEEQADTRPTSAFLLENNFYDANLYAIPRFGEKTLVVYDANDVMIS